MNNDGEKIAVESLSEGDREVLAWALRFCQASTTASKVQKLTAQTLLHRVERGDVILRAARTP